MFWDPAKLRVATSPPYSSIELYTYGTWWGFRFCEEEVRYQLAPRSAASMDATKYLILRRLWFQLFIAHLRNMPGPNSTSRHCFWTCSFPQGRDANQTPVKGQDRSLLSCALRPGHWRASSIQQDANVVRRLDRQSHLIHHRRRDQAP